MKKQPITTLSTQFPPILSPSVTSSSISRSKNVSPVGSRPNLTSKTITFPLSSQTINHDQTSSESFQPLASEHWKIRKQKLAFDKEMNDYYDQQIQQCRLIEESTNKQSEELFNTIVKEIKWSNPSVSNVHGRLIIQYCKHLIRYGSTKPFSKENDVKAWNIKCRATKREKICNKLKNLYIQLYKIIHKRDYELNNIQNSLLLTGETMKMKKDIKLKWMMESNEKNVRVKFFTIWDLTIRNRLRELKVLMHSHLQKHMMDYLQCLDEEIDQHLQQRDEEASFGDRGSLNEEEMSRLRIETVNTNEHSQYNVIIHAKSEVEGIINAIEENKDILIKEQEEELNQSNVNPSSSFIRTESTSFQGVPPSVHQADSFMRQYTLNIPPAVIVANFVNQKDPDFGLTSLHYACKYNHYRIAHFLLILGGNPNLTCPDGRNALHFAAAYGDKELLRLLLSKGGDAFAKDLYQCTPLDLAKQNDNKKTISTLLNWERITKEVTYQQHLHDKNKSTKKQLLEQTIDERQSEGSDKVGSRIPIEYHLVTDGLYQQMSSRLKLLVKRLNGCNPYLQEIMQEKDEELSSIDNTCADIMNSRLFALNSTSHLKTTTTRSETLVASAPPTFSSSFATNVEAKLDANELVTASQIEQDDYSYKERNTAESFLRAENEELNQCMLEIRLCSKYFVECIKENLIEEGIRTLYRRWMVGKHLYDVSIRRFYSAFDEISEMRQEESTLVDGTSVIDPTLSRGLSESHTLKSNEEGDVIEQIDKKIEEYDGPMELDKLTVEFYKTATNITYLVPEEAEVKVEDHKSLSEESATTITSVLSFPKIIKVSDNIYMEEENSVNLKYAENLSDGRRTQQKGVSEGESKEKVEENSLIEKKKIDNKAFSRQKNPEYILKTIQSLLEKEKIEKLQEYSWKFDHLLHSSYFPVLSSKFSSTISWVEENSMTISSVDFSTYQPFSSYFERFHGSSIMTKFKPPIATLPGNSLARGEMDKLGESEQFGEMEGGATLPRTSLINAVGLFPAGNYYISLGYDLIEINLLLKRYVKALLLLEECLFYTENIFISLRILLLLQKCDILLYLYDHYQDYQDGLKDELTRFFSFDPNDMLPLDEQNHEQQEEYDVSSSSPRKRTIKRNPNQAIIRGVLRYVNKEREFIFHAHQVQKLFPILDQASVSQRKMITHYLPQTNDSHELNSMSESLSLNSSSLLYIREEEKLEENHDNEHYDDNKINLNSKEDGHSDLYPRLDPPYQIEELEAVVSSSAEWLLSSCEASAQEIMSVSYLLSAKYIIEPYSIALALYYLGKVQEKRENFVNAWRLMEESSMIALRSQDISFEIMEIMLHVSLCDNSILFSLYLLLYVGSNDLCKAFVINKGRV